MRIALIIALAASIVGGCATDDNYRERSAYTQRQFGTGELSALMRALSDGTREWTPCRAPNNGCYRDESSGFWVKIDLAGSAFVGHRHWPDREAAYVDSGRSGSATALYTMIDAAWQRGFEKYDKPK